MNKAELLAEQSRLLALANELSRKHWGVDYTGTLTLINRYWRRKGACFTWNEDGRADIRMSAQGNVEIGEETVAAYLLHELVHWRLYTLGLPFADEDTEFIAEALRVGAPISAAGSAKKAYDNFIQKRAYEERTGKPHDEEAALLCAIYGVEEAA
jgi:hypothetical protein